MRQITAQYGGVCLTCEEPYEAGATVRWQSGVGCWHTDCPEPKNLRLQVKEKAKRSVFDPPEFGSAPMPDD